VFTRYLNTAIINVFHSNFAKKSDFIVEMFSKDDANIIGRRTQRTQRLRTEVWLHFDGLCMH